MGSYGRAFITPSARAVERLRAGEALSADTALYAAARSDINQGFARTEVYTFERLDAMPTWGRAAFSRLITSCAAGIRPKRLQWIPDTRGGVLTAKLPGSNPTSRFRPARSG